jgi:NAD(P)-dependent dehydrogenase (short-subunit alcohol dehydrogenase family)
MDWESFTSDTGYFSWLSYCQAKLANILFAAEFARRFSDSGITCVSLNPGLVKTEIARSKSWFDKLCYIFANPVFTLLAKTSAVGAYTVIHCAIDKEVSQQNGLYFS